MQLLFACIYRVNVYIMGLELNIPRPVTGPKETRGGMQND